MQIHGFVAFSVGRHLSEARPASFDLDFAAGLLLDVFDVRSALANNLGSKIETLDWLQVDGDTLLGPFPLKPYLASILLHEKERGIPVQIHLVPRSLVPAGGIGAHLRGWEVLAS